jgi:hypothetical protein
MKIDGTVSVSYTIHLTHEEEEEEIISTVTCTG